jgi:putative transposase
MMPEVAGLHGEQGERDASPLQDIVWSDMEYDAAKHHRRSIRLPGYNYASPGAYFVTICVHGGECLLGDVVDGEMRLNEWGKTASGYWLRIPDHFDHVQLDEWVVMPNHLHGIVLIVGRGEASPATTSVSDDPTPGEADPQDRESNMDASPLQPGSLGATIGNYKSVSTRRINRVRGTPGTRFWQRNYWEHIIRDERSLNRIREYIQNNPARWAEDQLHPDAPPNAFNRWQSSGL